MIVLAVLLSHIMHATALPLSAVCVSEQVQLRQRLDTLGDRFQQVSENCG